MNNHSSVGLVSQQWDAVDWVLCTVWISRSQCPSEQISFITTMCLPILQLSCRFFWQSITSPSSVSPPAAQLWLHATSVFPKAKIAVEREEIFECDDHAVGKISQRHLTADWLVPREIDCSRMNSKVSSDWLPSYNKTTLPVLEIFKMAEYFPDSPRRPIQYETNPHHKFMVSSQQQNIWSHRIKKKF